MNDEKLINKFLERNYKVITDDKYFKILDKENLKTHEINDFLIIFKKIFGTFSTIDNETSIELFHKWYGFYKRALTKNLSDYINTLNIEEGSVSLLFKVCSRFSHGEESQLYTLNFITEYVNDYYKEKILIPLLKKITNSFNHELGSTVLINTISDRLETETTYIYEFALNYLNKWYGETIIGDKMRDFLSQLVITLGSRNWLVTWIGHGPVSKEKILSNFKGEIEFHHKIIMEMYDKWYEIAVIEASERELNRNNYGSNFPGVNLETNF